MPARIKDESRVARKENTGIQTTKRQNGKTAKQSTEHTERIICFRQLLFACCMPSTPRFIFAVA